MCQQLTQTPPELYQLLLLNDLNIFKNYKRGTCGQLKGSEMASLTKLKEREARLRERLKETRSEIRAAEQEQRIKQAVKYVRALKGLPGQLPPADVVSKLIRQYNAEQAGRKSKKAV